MLVDSWHHSNLIHLNWIYHLKVLLRLETNILLLLLFLLKFGKHFSLSQCLLFIQTAVLRPCLWVQCWWSLWSLTGILRLCIWIWWIGLNQLINILFFFLSIFRHLLAESLHLLLLLLILYKKCGLVLLLLLRKLLHCEHLCLHQLLLLRIHLSHHLLIMNKLLLLLLLELLL